MAINLPGPYEVVYKYVTGGLTHEAKFNVVALGNPALGTPESSINFQTRSGVGAPMADCISDFWAFYRMLLPVATVSAGAELWRYVAGTFQKDFVTAHIGSLAAGNAPAYVIARQDVFSFRTANGGIMKVNVMETSNTSDQVIPLVANALGNDAQKMAAYIVSSAGWMIARDDAFPIQPLNWSNGQNEALYRKRTNR